mgnify:CR=1 FL=1
MQQSNKKICDVRGIKAAGIAAGIKSTGRKDAAVVVSEVPAKAAAVFTINRVKAAPVQISQKHLLSDYARAVILTSGNANAATAEEGLRTAEEMCKQAAQILECDSEEILIAQTGLIGIPLDRNTAINAVTKALAEVSSQGSNDAAEAIMTTDTKQKHASVEINLAGKTALLAGIAKGAAMLSPSMATMLALVVTDAQVEKQVLDHALKAAMNDSFHSMIVDGSRSTNDTVFLLANGLANNNAIDSTQHSDYKVFAEALAAVCQSLAKQMASDGEGATKFLTMRVRGASDKENAKIAAKAVVGSLLVKCSLAGENVYWGRVISELGASGAEFDPNLVEIKYGDITVCKHGTAAKFDEQAAAEYMRGSDIVITAYLGNGQGSAEAYGCDLTHAYVDENMSKS